MVLTLLLPARAIFKLHDVITPQHVDKMAKIILLTGSFVAYAYSMEFFVAWYSGNSYEKFAFWNRIFGPYWWYWWFGMLFCNCLSPQLFWFSWCRRNVFVVFFVCMCVNAGMWFERFIIIAGGLIRDFLPSSWRVFHPTWVDIWTYIGTIGIFTSLFPDFHSFSADDCHVRGEDGSARGGPALRSHTWDSIDISRRKGAHAMMRTPAGHKVYAMAAEYPSAAALYEAAKHVRDAGFKRWDVYSPFPIHGMDEAMGLGKSWLSGWVLFGGVTGLLTAAVVEFGPSSILYPLDVHGKPWNFLTVPAFFPIMFELTVLLGAFAAFFSMLGMNGLPRWYHPMFNWERFIRVSNDGFFLAIESRDPRFTENGVRELLEKTGGEHITIVHED